MFAFLNVVTISSFLISTMSAVLFGALLYTLFWTSVPARADDSSEVLHSAAAEPSSLSGI